MGSYVFKWDQPASEVIVTGTFDGWAKSVSLQKENGIFSKQVTIPSTDRKIQYKYIVDGVWALDRSVATEKDNLGNVNNVLDPADLQTLSVSPPPATRSTGNPINQAPAEPVPNPSSFASNTTQSTGGTMSDVVIESSGPFSKNYKPSDAASAAAPAAAAGDVVIESSGPFSKNFKGSAETPTGTSAGSTGSYSNKPFAGFKGQPSSPKTDPNKPFAGFKGQEAIRTSSATSPTTAKMAGQVPLEPSSRSATTSGLSSTAAATAGAAGAGVAAASVVTVGAATLSSKDQPSARIDDPTSVPTPDPNIMIADEDTMPAIAVANKQASPPNDPSADAFRDDPVSAPGSTPAPASGVVERDPRTVAPAFQSDPIDASAPAATSATQQTNATSGASTNATSGAPTNATSGAPTNASASAAAQAAAVDNKPFRGRQAAQAVQDKASTNETDTASTQESASVTKRSKRSSIMGKFKDAFIPKPAAQS